MCAYTVHLLQGKNLKITSIVYIAEKLRVSMFKVAQIFTFKYKVMNFDLENLYQYSFSCTVLV